MGKSYFIGESPSNAIKLDVYYTDKFQYNSLQIDEIRMISIKDIIAMKMDVIIQNGRKKDFWDIHALIPLYSADEMIHFYKERNQYFNNTELLKQKLIDFEFAENDFNPVCLKQKHWELVKLELYNFFK
jgi:hypothetical protein